MPVPFFSPFFSLFLGGSNCRRQLVRERSAADRWGRRVGLLGTALLTNRLVCPVDPEIDS